MLIPYLFGFVWSCIDQIDLLITTIIGIEIYFSFVFFGQKKGEMEFRAFTNYQDAFRLKSPFPYPVVKL